METAALESNESPYKSAYPRTEVCRQASGTFQFRTFRRARRRLRPRDSLRPRSPDSGRRCASISCPPDAPRPILQVNEDTVLFASTKRISKAGEFSKAATTREQRSSVTLPSLSAISEDAVTDDNMLKTSTPFARHTQTDSDPSELLNTALIGAPRLALNLSITDSTDDANRLDSTGPRCNISAICKTEIRKSSGTADHLMYDANAGSNFRPLDCEVVQSSCKSPQSGTNISKFNELSINQFRCRICLEGGDGVGALFSPCRCKGTVGLVHRTCLQRWLYESGKPNCELCGYAYIMTPSRRKSNSLHSYIGTSAHLGPFREWLNSPTTRRHLLTDLICLAFLTPSTYIGVYFCVIGAIGSDSEDPIGWQVVGLWCLAVLMMLLLFSWVILATRHHVSNYQRHLRLRRQHEREEAERLAALPRWRFSIQPRPRGSSTLVHSDIANGQTVSYQNTIFVEAQPIKPPSLENNSISEVEVHAQMIPLPSADLATSNNQELHVSLDLSTISGIMEECANADNERIHRHLV
ncbi:unnamed protein product [Dicrocoelium dendriticum]|nr:unnamed protein product [Dicrocoelium dendriticum]